MSRQKYIRILVNGKHVRSTGAEKWQRDLVLKNLGMIDCDEDYDQNRALIEIPNKVLDSILPDYLPITTMPIIISCHLMQRNTSGKHVKHIYKTPFRLELERTKSGFRLNKRVYETTTDSISITDDKEEPIHLYNYYFQVSHPFAYSGDGRTEFGVFQTTLSVVTNCYYDVSQLIRQLRTEIYKGIESQDGNVPFTDDTFKEYVIQTVNRVLGDTGKCTPIELGTIAV